MKHLPLIVLMVIAVAACNLTDKLRKSSSSNSPSSSSGSEKIGSETVEKPNPTAAETAAIANGKEVKWDQQGISWTLPPNWKQETVTNDTFNYGSGNGAFLIVSISSMSSDFPTEISLRAFHEGAKVREKNGQVDELKWLELDGARGVEFRESKPQMADDIRRLQWMTYRKFGGQTQLVNFILSTSAGKFDQHKDELYGVLYSTKIVH